MTAHGVKPESEEEKDKEEELSLDVFLLLCAGRVLLMVAGKLMSKTTLARHSAIQLPDSDAYQSC